MLISIYKIKGGGINNLFLSFSLSLSLSLSHSFPSSPKANGLGIVLAELGHAEASTNIFAKINEQSAMLHSRINLAHMLMADVKTDQSKEAVKLYEICVDQCDKKNTTLHVEYLIYLARAYARSSKDVVFLLSSF